MEMSMDYIDYVIENGEVWLQYAVQLNVKNERTYLVGVSVMHLCYYMLY